MKKHGSDLAVSNGAEGGPKAHRNRRAMGEEMRTLGEREESGAQTQRHEDNTEGARRRLPS